MDNDPYLEKSKPIDARFEGPTFIDPLTGLFNRYYMDQFIPQELKKAHLSNYPLSLLMIDVDKFKKINDTYGHLCGDKVLTQVAGIIRKAIRQTDTVIRYAGDEFIVLLSGADKERARTICNNMISDIEKTVFAGDKNQDLRVTLSIGYAIYPEDAKEQLQLIDMADKALYLSKKRGRNRLSSAKEVTVEEVSSLVAMNSFPCRSFINHQQESDTLKGLFSTVVKSGLLQAAFISGPSGVGKSRILNELKTYIKDEVSIICCNSSSSHAQDPYYLFARGIAAYIDKAGIDNPQVTDTLLRVPTSELSELGLIIPQLRNIIRKSSDLRADDKGRRFLLFKAFMDLLVELSSFSPVLIIFDDIHWADKASLELLRYLIKQEKNKKILVACAFSDDRSPGRPDNSELHNLTQETSKGGNVTAIRLGNLSAEDTEAMIEAVFPGVGKAKEFSALIYSTTKGSPYFIEETLKSLVEKGIIFYHKDCWQVKGGVTAKDVPASLDEIIKGRLTNLDDETKEMILQAAVIGKNFQMDTLKKIGDKNEGFVSELIGRAKDMRLVSELDGAGGFNFVNENTQNILYGELNENEREKIHYKIAQVLVNEHKDSLYDVAGEAAFHYSRAPEQERALKVGKELLEKTKELFNPNEMREYLEQFAQDFLGRKEKTVVELSDKTMKDATRFILLLQGAMKKIRLYPPASAVRLNIVKEVYQLLSSIFNEADSLVISEVEKSLVINGKRLSPSEESHAKAGDFLYIMMEHGIKTIALKKGLEEGELNNLIGHLEKDRKDITSEGGWAAVINREGLEHIGIDELHFISVDEYAQASRQKKPLQDLMLMEFLLGKVDPASVNREEMIFNIEKNPQKIAQTISDVAKITAEKDKRQDEAGVVTDVITKIDSQILGGRSKGGDHRKDLANVVLALEPNLRNKVIHSLLSESREEQKKVAGGIMSAITDDFIIDMIIDNYKDNMRNPLVAREVIDHVLVKVGRENEILAKLKPRLVELDINEKDLDFIVGKTAWEDLSMDRRTEMLLGLPGDYYSGPMLSRISNILDELDSANKKEDIKDTISRFLAKTKKIDETPRRNLLRTIGDFIKEPFAGKKEDLLQKAYRINCILEKLEVETDPAIFGCLLEVIKQTVEYLAASGPDTGDFVPTAKKSGNQRILFIDRLFSLLLRRFKMEEGKVSQIRELISNFILDSSSPLLIKILAYCIIEDIQKNKYDVKDMYLILKDEFIDALIELAVKKNAGIKDPFDEFLTRRKIAGLLINLKNASSGRLRKILSNTGEDISAPLIELVGHLQSDELVDALLPFISHREQAIRIAVIQALSEIGGEKSVEMLSRIVKEEQDSDIRDLANVRLQKLKKKAPPQR